MLKGFREFLTAEFLKVVCLSARPVGDAQFVIDRELGKPPEQLENSLALFWSGHIHRF